VAKHMGEKEYLWERGLSAHESYGGQHAGSEDRDHAGQKSPERG
jgi:hypothetical protein